MNFDWKDEIREFLDDKLIVNCELVKEYSKNWVTLKI